jgi:hypothetical protein
MIHVLCYTVVNKIKKTKLHLADGTTENRTQNAAFYFGRYMILEHVMLSFKMIMIRCDCVLVRIGGGAQRGVGK